MLKQICSFTFIWLLMAISTAAQITWPPVLDSDGQPIMSGVEYYVVPTRTDTAGGLTLINRVNPCPLHVGQELRGSGDPFGLPLVFTPRVNTSDNIIRETRDFIAEFSSVGATVCIESLAWRVGEVDAETGRRFILTGGEAGYFNIVKDTDLDDQYVFQWCPNCLVDVCPKPLCGSAGIQVENGKRFLVLDGPAYPFMFRKVSSYHSPY